MKADGDAAGLYMVVWCLITTSILALVLGILIDSVTDEGKVVIDHRQESSADESALRGKWLNPWGLTKTTSLNGFVSKQTRRGQSANKSARGRRAQSDAGLGLDEDEEKTDSDDDDGDDDEVEGDEVALQVCLAIRSRRGACAKNGSLECGACTKLRSCDIGS